MKKLCPTPKKEIGKRFKKFRESIGKSQTQLAKELNLYQSTITNIEVGKTFPNIKYLQYFFLTYGLNANWLMNNSGEMIITSEERDPTVTSLLPCHLPKDDPKYKSYLELMRMMKHPVIEQILLAKLAELIITAKVEIKEFPGTNEIENKRRSLRK